MIFGPHLIHLFLHLSVGYWKPSGWPPPVNVVSAMGQRDLYLAPHSTHVRLLMLIPFEISPSVVWVALVVMVPLLVLVLSFASSLVIFWRVIPFVAILETIISPLVIISVSALWSTAVFSSDPILI